MALFQLSVLLLRIKGALLGIELVHIRSSSFSVNIVGHHLPGKHLCGHLLLKKDKFLSFRLSCVMLKLLAISI